MSFSWSRSPNCSKPDMIFFGLSCAGAPGFSFFLCFVCCSSLSWCGVWAGGRGVVWGGWVGILASVHARKLADGEAVAGVSEFAAVCVSLSLGHRATYAHARYARLCLGRRLAWVGGWGGGWKKEEEKKLCAPTNLLPRPHPCGCVSLFCTPPTPQHPTQSTQTTQAGEWAASGAWCGTGWRPCWP